MVTINFDNALINSSLRIFRGYNNNMLIHFWSFIGIFEEIFDS